MGKILLPDGKTMKLPGVTTSKVSDGYHTFEELYAHRTALFRALCVAQPSIAWKSLNHEDGGEPMHEGMFVAGLNLGKVDPQDEDNIMEMPITYHIDLKYWDFFDIPIHEYAPKWDGHTSKDVARRLMEW